MKMKNNFELCKEICKNVKKYLEEGLVFSEQEERVYKRIMFFSKKLNKDNAESFLKMFLDMFKKYNLKIKGIN